MLIRSFFSYEEPKIYSNSLANDDTCKENNSELLIDKVGLRLESRFLVKTEIRNWQKGNITILQWGNTSQINIHPEFMPMIDNIGFRCLLAIIFLIINGVFVQDFASSFLLLNNFVCRHFWTLPFWPRLVIEKFFSLGEWETTFDFYDYPLVSSYDSQYLRNYMGTLYTRDKKTKRRQIGGKKLSKGSQNSFLAIYDRARRLQQIRECHRMEFRHQGYYHRDLDISLLDGTITEAYHKLLPSIALIINQKMKPESICFQKYWIQHKPWWLSELLDAIQKYSTSQSDAKPRRKKISRGDI